MTIIEAIASGKPFKRRIWLSYHERYDDQITLAFTVKDILADDWEILPEKISLSLDKIYDSVANYCVQNYGECGNRSLYRHLDRTLGFKKKKGEKL